MQLWNCGALSTALVVAGVGVFFGNNQIDRNRSAIVASLIAPAICFMVALAYSLSAAARDGFTLVETTSVYGPRRTIHTGPLPKR